jgi:hypothetical protein
LLIEGSTIPQAAVLLLVFLFQFQSALFVEMLMLAVQRDTVVSF